MTKKNQLLGLVNRINNSKLMQGVHLNVECENGLFYVRIYKGDSCENSLLGGDSAGNVLKELYAFHKGLFFVNQYAEKTRGIDFSNIADEFRG